MAIQHPFTHPSGVVLNEAYHRVMSSDIQRRIGSGGAISGEVTGIVQVYKDETSREQGLEPVQSFQFNVTGGDYTTFFETAVLDQTNVNSVSQTYNWMKTQTNLNGIDYTRDSTDV